MVTLRRGSLKTLTHIDKGASGGFQRSSSNMILWRIDGKWAEQIS